MFLSVDEFIREYLVHTISCFVVCVTAASNWLQRLNACLHVMSVRLKTCLPGHLCRLTIHYIYYFLSLF